MENIDAKQLKIWAEKLTEIVQNPGGLNMRHRARNKVLVPLNEMRKAVGLEPIPEFYVCEG